MKIKISKSQWSYIGKLAGWKQSVFNSSNQTDTINMYKIDGLGCFYTDDRALKVAEEKNLNPDSIQEVQVEIEYSYYPGSARTKDYPGDKPYCSIQKLFDKTNQVEFSTLYGQDELEGSLLEDHGSFGTKQHLYPHDQFGRSTTPRDE